MFARTSKSTGLGLVATAITAIALLAACGGSSTSTTPEGGNADSNALVQTRSDSGNRMLLVDAHGKTLYAADQDLATDIKCTGSCLGFWFPLTTTGTAAATGDGVPAGKLGTVKRPDTGKMQVTFGGKPLYTFKLDGSAGSTKGDGFTDDFDGTTFDWHAVTVTGVSTGSPSSDSDSGGHGGYGY
jgi:predicted lipoprotein with Yx(FWY)xxD motif